MSGTLNIKGTNEFPNYPIKIYVTMKKITISAWVLVITLQISSAVRNPVWPSSALTSVPSEFRVVPNHSPKMT